MATYTTQDAWAAAWLVANGIRLLRVQKGYWSSWVFEDSDRIPDLLDTWQTGSPVMDVKRYAQACQEVRRAQRNAA